MARREASVPFLNLDWGLQDNSDFRTILYSTYFSNPGYLRYVDRLIATLRTQSVERIQEKLSDVSDIPKFRSAISELEVARILSSKYPTQLLPDNTWEGPSPDMVVKRGDREILIEVKRLTQDEAEVIIVSSLRQFLPAQRPAIRVDVTLSEKLALPVVKLPERVAKEGIAERSIEEFKAKFSTVAEGTLPADIPTEGAIFTLLPTNARKEGYPGIIRSGVIKVPEDLLIEKLVEDVCDKAGKRGGFPPQKRTSPYVVAIDSEQISVDDITLGRAFIGDTVLLMPPLQVPKEPTSPEVARANSRSWQTFLKRTAIIPSGRSYLPRESRGAFFTRRELRNVSLVMLRTAASHYSIPNPFCDDSINDSSLTSFI